MDIVLIRGAGDLATGVALRLYRAGLRVMMTEVEAPLAVRRTVSFSEAVFSGTAEVEGVRAGLAEEIHTIGQILQNDEIPIIVDPDLERLQAAADAVMPRVVVDARLMKTKAVPANGDFIIGLGPGFTPGENCRLVVETMRGHTLGRVYSDRPALADTGLPDGNPERVLRASRAGVIRPKIEIAEFVRVGDLVAEIEGPDGRMPVEARVGGVLRGMLRDGAVVRAGLKIGDIDERGEPSHCYLVSDKSLAIGGGVLEAILEGLNTGVVGLFRRMNRPNA